ncbi:MAG: hypothetical protein WCE98_02935 [Chlorobium sp.]
MNPAVQNRQIIDLSHTAFGLPVSVIQTALLGYQHLLADKLFRHGTPADGEQVVFGMKPTMQRALSDRKKDIKAKQQPFTLAQS